MKIVKIRNSSKLHEVLSEIDKAGLKDVEVHIYGTDSLSYSDAFEIATNIRALPDAKVTGMTDLNLKGLIILCSVDDRSLEIESVVIIDSSVLNSAKDIGILEKALCKESISKLKDLDLKNLIVSNSELNDKLLKKHGLCFKFNGEKIKRKKRATKKSSSKETPSTDTSETDKKTNDQSTGEKNEVEKDKPLTESKEEDAGSKTKSNKTTTVKKEEK